jgi:hypothetical protein
MEREIFQKQYDFEMTQKDTLSSTVNIPIVSITVIGSALSGMLLSFPYSKNCVSYFFIISIAICFAFCTYALILVFKSLVGYLHHKIPSSSALYAYHKELLNWHLQQGVSEEEATKKAENEFSEYFNRKLSEASDANSENNIKRSAYIHDATLGTAMSLIFLAMSAFFFVYAKTQVPAQEYKIEIINPIEIAQEESKMTTSNSGSTTPSSAPAAAPAPKPVEPQNVVFKGNVVKSNSSSSSSSSKK